MLTKPTIPDETIIRCLKNAYGLDIEKILFLPIGADFNTAVYRATTHNERDYFLKLRRGEWIDTTVTVPKYFAELGIKQVIPPFLTKNGHLWTDLELFRVILYPYIDGYNGIETPLSDQQQIEFGQTMKKIHTVAIPQEMAVNIPRETFPSKWRETVKIFLKRIEHETFEEPIAAKLAQFLKSKKHEISNLINRAEDLLLSLQNQPIEYVLCHADIHEWNLLINKNGQLYIVDWDTILFAPKERDLMFIGSGIGAKKRNPAEEEMLFYQGYGQTNINQSAISFYRFERVIQDIGEYCEHIFLSNADKEDRAQSFEYLQSNFIPGGTIERAYHGDKTKK